MKLENRNVLLRYTTADSVLQVIGLRVEYEEAESGLHESRYEETLFPRKNVGLW